MYWLSNYKFNMDIKMINNYVLSNDDADNKVTMSNVIDPINNKSVYNFKKGLGGREVQYAGELEWSNIPFFNKIMSILL